MTESKSTQQIRTNQMSGTQRIILRLRKQARQQMINLVGTKTGINNYTARLVDINPSDLSKMRQGKLKLRQAKHLYNIANYLQEDMQDLYLETEGKL